MLAADTLPDFLLAEDMGRFYADPLGWVMYAYPWDTDPSIQLVELKSPWKERYGCKYGPDVWACEDLDRLGEEIKKRGFDGKKAVDPIQSATVSGHGVGKSTMTAWIVGFLASTRPYSRGVVTANTSNQLETKTWAEVSKWNSKSLTGHWFDVNTSRGSMSLKHKLFPDSWRCDALTCREENSESFAGLHAANSTAYYIFDEASAVPDKIWEVAEGGMTDGEPMWFVFGNGTRSSGRFRECFRKYLRRWLTRNIDSRTCQITNKDKIDDWIEDHGIDSDFVKVRVLGKFPNISAKQFFSQQDVDQAVARDQPEVAYNFAPRILVVDPAWEGDDMMEIGMRQGLKFKLLRTIPKNDNDVEMANLIARLADETHADHVWIDAGYGTGIYSVGQSLGRENWKLVWFGSAATNPAYVNKRAEMYGDAKTWLKDGGDIPDDMELQDQLLSIETVPKIDGKIQLESKKDMKSRGLPSPGKADLLAISFAFPADALMRSRSQPAVNTKPHSASRYTHRARR